MGNIDTEKLKAIESAMGQIEKQFGKGSVMKFGDTIVTKYDAISTGCLDLDIALELVVYLRGRIIEIYGPESSGKTTVALTYSCRSTKKRRGSCDL